jgi:hypothetical protein
MTPSQRLEAINGTANEAIASGQRLRISHGVAFTLPTLFVSEADKHDIAILVHSRSANTIRFKSMSSCSITFRLVY